ncbi:hypothetical protein TVAG_429490 [Trichomonas vaginalis G3]|uniref:Uncharacterized protein n=1 Tax=Trichomonas vaginalis (strain ATCC PRA-98 / G3) TaxID=412133 RepID=A2FC56_TRIV3|nr:hypothetical protein TVAGG3_0646390 [Trichomonas vaginalis G3]EAX97513.1 hypothetical protein TVAG_429490 [Trichomonas vaginalis G3]KAI5505535.1 hypothetical protein TVAGG3_0646390 [Trichomonas vaginalis G3]|eukprot:XP_001310443.1 hypothetical protein [Trichomonas vaginalis G3]
MEKLKEYEKYGFFKFNTLSNNPLTETYKTFMQNIKYLRGVFLTEMFYCDGADFFGVPNAPDLFASIHKECRPSNRVIAHILCQKITTNIVQFYNEPVAYSTFVAKYLETDPTNHFLFAYSTFPAMFCYFASEEFLIAGSQFIRTFIYNNNDLITSEALVSSFFHCIPSFYSFFLSTFAQKTLYFYESTPFESYYKAFKEVLLQSLPLLTYSHVQVVLLLIQKFSDEEAKFVIEDVFYKHYLSYKEFSGYFTDNTSKKGLETFFKRLIDEKSLEVIDIMSSTGIVYNPYPKIQGIHWFRGCPTIMSEYDVKLLIDIISSNDESSYLQDSKKIHFSENWNPLLFNIFPDFLSNTSIYDRLGDALFGIQPDKIDIRENPTFERIYKNVANECEQNNLNIIDFVEEKFPDIMKYGELIEYIYNRANNDCYRNFDTLQQYILDIETLESHQNYTQLIENHLSIIFHRFAYDFISKATSACKGSVIQKVSSCYDLITCNEKISTSVSFSMWCAAFDAIYFHDSEILNSDVIFNHLLEEKIQTYQREIKEDPYIRHIYLHIISTSTIISHLSEVGYGQQLIFMSRFMFNMKLLVPDFFSPLWHKIFAFCLFMSKETKIFRTFIFYISFVSDSQMTQFWGHDIIDSFQKFTTSFHYLIKDCESLRSICTNPMQCQRILEMSRK